METQSGSPQIERNYSVNEIVKTTKHSRRGIKAPRLFKIRRIDNDWGVVEYNDNGRIDTIGLGNIMKANYWDRIVFWLLDSVSL